MVRNEMETFLHAQLTDEDFNNPEVREKALEEQINWYWEHHDTLIEETLAKGNGTTMARKILRPIVQMVSAVLLRLRLF